MRGIPPRTSTGMWRWREASRALTASGGGTSSPYGSVGRAGRAGVRQERHPEWRPRALAKPRRWVYATLPIFKKLREPLVEVFREAEEVHILVDLGDFKREEIRFGRNGESYEVAGLKDGQEFREKIALPPNVDMDLMRESFRNGILQITLPKRKGRSHDRNNSGRSRGNG